MKALQLVARNMLEIRDVSIPDIASDEVLVKVAGAGLCHSDVHVKHTWDYSGPGLTLGHETAGYVAAVGSNVTGLAEGEAVLVCVIWACGSCRACIHGRDNACMRMSRNGEPVSPGLGPDGGMAEYMKVKARHLERLGLLDPTTAGPLADAGLTPMHAINGAMHRLSPGSTAAVIAVGGLGQMAVQILAQTTGARIIAIDSSREKLERALECGADEVLMSDASTASNVLDLTDGYGADAVFDFAGVQATVDLAAQIVAPDGALRFIGLGGGSLSYPVGLSATPIPWGVEIRRSYGGTRADQRQVIELARRGKLQITARLYQLQDGIAAFDDLEAGRVPGRAILVP